MWGGEEEVEEVEEEGEEKDEEGVLCEMRDERSIEGEG